jgi:hypothetical protein
VFVNVIFKDADRAKVMEAFLKVGTEKINDVTYTSFLYAHKGETMRDCLVAKFNETMQEWATGL